MDKGATFAELFEPVVRSLGCELWGVDYRLQGKRGLLVVYIDKEGGVDVDDCANVSHQLSGLLDVEDLIQEEYVLEVSSPGMDRPLYSAEQYSAYTGSMIKVKLRRAYEGRRNFKGILKAVEDNTIQIVVDDFQYDLPIEGIEKANVVPVY
jgi:ribosome maturation factor RimP